MLGYRAAASCHSFLLVCQNKRDTHLCTQLEELPFAFKCNFHTLSDATVNENEDGPLPLTQCLLPQTKPTVPQTAETLGETLGVCLMGGEEKMPSKDPMQIVRESERERERCAVVSMVLLLMVSQLI